METIKSQNLDANESAFFGRELEHIKARTYDIKRPELKAPRLIPVSTEAGSGAETITYEQWDEVGMMKIISNYADDLPRADVKAAQFTSLVKSLGASYGYNIQEIRNAQKAGKPLNARKANSVRRAYDQAVNRIAWFGQADGGMLGMLSQPNVPAAAVATGVTTSNTRWIGASPKNAEEIITDLNDICTNIIETTKGVESADTLLMPVAQLRKISTTQKSSASDTTILEFFMKSNPGIMSVEWVNELKDVTPLPSGTAGTKDVMIAYRKDPENLTLELPQPFEQFPAQERNLEFVVPTHARIGGVIVYYPLSMRIVEGI